MKFYAVFALVVASVVSEPYFVPPGFVTIDTHQKAFQEQTFLQRAADSQKIASGTIAKKGEFPEFCFLSISFFQKSQTCGCTIWGKRHVVTSARCVKDCSEGTAANVTVTIPAASGAEATKKIESIAFPDGKNGATFLGEYKDDGIPDFRTIKENNAAVIRVASDIVFDVAGNVRAAKVTAEADATAWNTAHKAADGWKLRACGVGVINNQGERSKGVACVDINLQDAANCKEKPTDETPITIPAGQVCLQWPDRDNNVCVGDYGGPVYAYKTDPKGAIDGKTQEFFCILVGSPNVRNNAQCLDGHVVFCQTVFGPAAAAGTQGWINAIITPPPPPPAF